MLSDQDLQSLHAVLIRLEKRLASDITLSESSSEPVALDQTLQGRVSRGDALQQQAMAKATLVALKKRLVRVHKALKRFEDEDYGYCLDCGEEILKGRLEIMPEVELCVACSEKQER